MTMASTLPDESSAGTDSPKNTPEEFVITFLLGPPTRGVDAIAFAEVAEKRGLAREEFWVRVVMGKVGRLLEPSAEGRSILDGMFSEALGESVTLREVQGMVSLEKDRALPGFILEPEKVLDVLGRPTECNLTDQKNLSRIAGALMGFTRADMVLCLINSEESATGFPFLRDHSKEAKNA